MPLAKTLVIEHPKPYTGLTFTISPALNPSPQAIFSARLRDTQQALAFLIIGTLRGVGGLNAHNQDRVRPI